VHLGPHLSLLSSLQHPEAFPLVHQAAAHLAPFNPPKPPAHHPPLLSLPRGTRRSALLFPHLFPFPALSRDEPWGGGARGRGDASAGPMAAAPSLPRWRTGWRPRAPERNPRRSLPRPQTLGAAPTSSRPSSSLYRAAAHGGFPPCPPQEERRRGEEGGGEKEERWRPPVEEPRLPRRWTATSPPACRRGRRAGENAVLEPLRKAGRGGFRSSTPSPSTAHGGA
jgi:hypothetical protein